MSNDTECTSNFEFSMTESDFNDSHSDERRDSCNAEQPAVFSLACDISMIDVKLLCDSIIKESAAHLESHQSDFVQPISDLQFFNSNSSTTINCEEDEDNDSSKRNMHFCDSSNKQTVMSVNLDDSISISAGQEDFAHTARRNAVRYRKSHQVIGTEDELCQFSKPPTTKEEEAAASFIQHNYRSFRMRSDYNQLIETKRQSKRLPIALKSIIIPVCKNDNIIKNDSTLSDDNPDSSSTNFTDLTINDVKNHSDMNTTDTNHEITNTTDPIIRRRALIREFNRKPSEGLQRLIQEGFLNQHVDDLTNFLMHERFLSRQAVGEFFGNFENLLARATFEHFMKRLDLHEKTVDGALRFFLTYFHIPGESQKILAMVQAFQESYLSQNPNNNFKDADTVAVLCYAILMLHTEHHNPNARNPMKLQEFIKNLRGIDKGEDLDNKMLTEIYQRTVTQPFKTTTDPVDEVKKISQSLVGYNIPTDLISRERRFVCLSIDLSEIVSKSMFSRTSCRERCIFLFNDSILITKRQINNKSFQRPMFIFKRFLPLSGASARLLCLPNEDDPLKKNFIVELWKSSRCILRLIPSNIPMENSSIELDELPPDVVIAVSNTDSIHSTSPDSKKLSLKDLADENSNKSSQFSEIIKFFRQLDETLAETYEVEHINEKTSTGTLNLTNSQS